MKCFIGAETGDVGAIEEGGVRDNGHSINPKNRTRMYRKRVW